MFTHITIHHPHPQHREALIESMRRVAETADGVDGLVRIGPWEEQNGNRCVNIAVWTTREAYELAHSLVVAVVADDPFDEWEALPVENLYLDEL
ncbi:MAG: hypothetical protein JWQ68_1854 [Cryobacterium sp.]|jgi:hypothetical protein|nr:hypothetical protein [Cryobacterium sp.]